MPRKCISGFAEAGAAMAQQLDDNDLLNLFSAFGRVVSKRFLMKRPSLDRWQLVIDYLTSAMAFQPREQFRVLYLDKRNNLIADEVLAEGTVDHLRRTHDHQAFHGPGSPRPRHLALALPPGHTVCARPDAPDAPACSRLIFVPCATIS
jgi:RadC-like JAB domain